MIAGFRFCIQMLGQTPQFSYPFTAKFFIRAVYFHFVQCALKPLIWDTSGELIIAHWAAVTTILNGIDAGLIKAGATAVHYIGILENTQTDTAVSLELFGRFFYEGTVKSSPKFTLLFHNS